MRESKKSPEQGKLPGIFAPLVTGDQRGYKDGRVRLCNHLRFIKAGEVMSHKQIPSRRQFLGTAVAAAAAPWIIPSHVLGLGGAVAPSEKITLGVIGIGPRCTYDLTAMLKLPDVQCVAIADVQASRRDAGKKLVDTHYGNEDLKLYRDFREILDRKDIDAVLVATGDRWHAAASMLAAEAGKDVYSEKPCGLTIELCQQLAATMKKTGRIFQAGTQRRSVPNFQQAVKLAQTGKLGKLQTL
jgi:Oxidoreductase family, NAD-binding Rossmann fold